MKEGTGAADSYEFNKEERAWHWEDDLYPPFAEALWSNAPIIANLESKNTTIGTATTSTPATTTVVKGSNAKPKSTSCDIITVDDSTNNRHIETGIIIGRAKPHCCRDPNIRPVARAILTNGGAVVAYIPAKYAKRTETKGEVQIAMKDVDYTGEYEMITCHEKRLQFLRENFQLKNGTSTQRTPATSSVVDPTDTIMSDAEPVSTTDRLSEDNSQMNNDTQYCRNLKEEGIIIGRAKANACRNPKEPPVVRAVLNSVGSVIAYIPGKDSTKPCAVGRSQIHLGDVDYVEEFVTIASAKRSKVIKERILEYLNPIRDEEAGVGVGEGSCEA